MDDLLKALAIILDVLDRQILDTDVFRYLERALTGRPRTPQLQVWCHDLIRWMVDEYFVEDRPKPVARLSVQRTLEVKQLQPVELTSEQVALYRAVVDETMAQIA